LQLAEEFQLRKLLDECDVILASELSRLNATALHQKKVYSVPPSFRKISTRRMTIARQYLCMAVRHNLPKLQAKCCEILSSMDYVQLIKFIVENINGCNIPHEVMLHVMYPRLIGLENAIPVCFFHTHLLFNIFPFSISCSCLLNYTLTSIALRVKMIIGNET